MAYTLPVLKSARGEGCRAIGTLASGLPSVGFSAQAEAVASVHCRPGLDVTTVESGGVHPALPAFVAHTMGELRLRDLLACGPGSDLTVGGYGPTATTADPGDELWSAPGLTDT